MQHLFTQVEALIQKQLEPISPIGVRVGQQAPLVTGRTSQGDTASLADMPKPLLLIFYSELCLPSRQLLLKLPEVKQIYPELEILLVAANGRAESASPWTTILDDGMKLFERYGITGTPTILLIDREGVIRWLQVGHRADFLEVLEAVLGAS